MATKAPQNRPAVEELSVLVVLWCCGEEWMDGPTSLLQLAHLPPPIGGDGDVDTSGTVEQ